MFGRAWNEITKGANPTCNKLYISWSPGVELNENK